MKATKIGYIFFNTVTKSFLDTDYQITEDMSEAKFYSDISMAEKDLNSLDDPNSFVVWPVELIIRTTIFKE